MAKKNPQRSAEKIRHVESTHPHPWPGIPGRSHGHEPELETGTRRAEQADVTEQQRKLEDEVEGSGRS